MSTNPAGARVGNVLRYARAELERLEKVDAELRLPAAIELLNALEELTNEARQARAGAILDLRRSSPDRKAKTWRELALISGTEVKPQAVQQWADQYVGA